MLSPFSDHLSSNSASLKSVERAFANDGEPPGAASVELPMAENPAGSAPKPKVCRMQVSGHGSPQQ